MSPLRQLAAIIWKDISAELRTKEMFSSMFVFVFLAIVVFNFAFELRVDNVRQVAPGILWVAFSFAGVLGLNRSFILEKDRGCLEGLLLSPMDRSLVYVAKVISNVLFMLVVEALALPIFTALFNLPLLRPDLAVVVLLGTLGFAGVGTLFSAMVVNTRAREVLLPVLLFPIVTPVLIAAVKLTAGLLDGQALSQMGNWLRLLGAFDVIFLAVSYMTFDYVVEE
ncbi:MAG: heme exporter protein CcmB [Anaerolineae bacterium]|nr:heme exporter protein CcmB [Anaerolineae bacterium]